MAKRVGFIALGHISKPMAINIAKGGFDLMVYDLRDEPMRELSASGARAARSADEVGAHVEIIEVVVVDDTQVEAALLGEGGVFSGAKRGSIIAIYSTVYPRTVRKLAEPAGAKDSTVIDAEVSGGERGAIAKSLCYGSSPARHAHGCPGAKAHSYAGRYADKPDGDPRDGVAIDARSNRGVTLPGDHSRHRLDFGPD
jgi:6-phosphogluconate dehydrogenase (decarboxylating)